MSRSILRNASSYSRCVTETTRWYALKNNNNNKEETIHVQPKNKVLNELLSTYRGYFGYSGKINIDSNINLLAGEFK